MLRLAAEVRVRLARGSTLPSDDTVATLAAFKAPVTWNRYLPTLRGWERYAAGMNTPFLPADPGHFANYLADAAKKDTGSTQSKHRSCGIAALSMVAGVTSPTEDGTVTLVRAGLRRRLKGGRRGSARPIFPHEVPAAPASPPSGRGRDAHRPLSVRRRARAQVTRHMSVLSAASLRFDDTLEGQLGDISWFPGVAELSLFGTKTDPLLRGQAAVLPASETASSGFQAALQSARTGLSRLLDLPTDTLRAMATTFVARFSEQELGDGSREMSAWPLEIRTLAAPLYAQGIPVHCLPLLGEWQYERLSAASDLGAPMTLREFVRIARTILAEHGIDVTRFGAHSFRRGSAGALFHAGLGTGVVSTALRHRTPLASEAYVPEAARMAALADTLTLRRVPAVDEGALPHRAGGAAPRVRPRTGREPPLLPAAAASLHPLGPARRPGGGGAGGAGGHHLPPRGRRPGTVGHLAPARPGHPIQLDGRPQPPVPLSHPHPGREPQMGNGPAGSP